MIVIADTSPLNYLVLIGEIDLLAVLCERVLIPTAVFHELQQTGAPETVREWAVAMPAWCEVRSPGITSDSDLEDLDPGEREAIRLALECGVDTLLMDEAAGRRAALKRHLHVRGTVAILEVAARRGIIDFRAALAKLETTNFRLSASIRNEFLKRNP